MSSRSIPCFSAIAKRSSTPCRGVQVLSFAPFFPFLYREEEKEHHPRRDETNRLRFDRLVRARVAKFDWSVSVVEDFYWWLDSGTIRSSTHTSHRARAWPDNKIDLWLGCHANRTFVFYVRNWGYWHFEFVSLLLLFLFHEVEGICDLSSWRIFLWAREKNRPNVFPACRKRRLKGNLFGAKPKIKFLRASAVFDPEFGGRMIPVRMIPVRSTF